MTSAQTPKNPIADALRGEKKVHDITHAYAEPGHI